jgi:hypothetical protein
LREEQQQDQGQDQVDPGKRQRYPADQAMTIARQAERDDSSNDGEEDKHGQ